MAISENVRFTSTNEKDVLKESKEAKENEIKIYVSDLVDAFTLTVFSLIDAHLFFAFYFRVCTYRVHSIRWTR